MSKPVPALMPLGHALLPSRLAWGLLILCRLVAGRSRGVPSVLGAEVLLGLRDAEGLAFCSSTPHQCDWCRQVLPSAVPQQAHSLPCRVHQ